MRMAQGSPRGSENTVGKEEIARYEQFLLFPQTVFSKDLYYRYVKTRACLGKGQKTLLERRKYCLPLDVFLLFLH